MSHLRSRDDSAAPRGACLAGAVRLASDRASGPVALNSNRPAIGAGSAPGLRKQLVAAH